MPEGIQLSTNFLVDEFVCKCGCGLSAMDPHLVNNLQDLRTAYGRPIKVLSGVRCRKHNAAVGGALKSWHLGPIGHAVDITVPIAQEMLWPTLLYVLELATSINGTVGFSGFGIARKYLHLDTREELPGHWYYLPDGSRSRVRRGLPPLQWPADIPIR